MKKSLYFLALLGLVLILPACQKEAVVDDNGLTSPSGLRLADNYESLEAMIEGYYKATHDIRIEATVTNVKWISNKGVDAAVVQYQDETGRNLSFGYTQTKNVIQDPALLENGAARLVGGATVTCEKDGCTTRCALGTFVDPGTGGTYYDCGCIGDPNGSGCKVVMSTGTIN